MSDPGRCPDGDPEAIHAFAAELRRTAGKLAAVPSPAVHGWESPEASRIRGVLSLTDNSAERTADELRACAASLDNAARVLADDQRVWRAAKRRMEEAR